MSGSLKWFVYVTDDGDEFAIYGDESNAEALTGADGDYATGADFPRYALPRNVKPRTVTLRNAARTRSVSVVIPGLSSFAAVSGTYTLGGETFTVTGKKGESTRLPFGEDTGLNDGDAT